LSTHGYRAASWCQVVIDCFVLFSSFFFFFFFFFLWDI
jgi:hypothetical protein